ncbi:hypothetical protein TIFTF001_041920 [Ficus carica]|uniref:Uncharacterized protein n=1 Tax=Ficus carica TaxID=3494 RepID=A0AA87ZIP0_FICCA|nr:hypothetical protein TIFTF001_041920 [Ficus carica]
MKSLGFMIWFCCIVVLVLLLNPPLGDRFGRKLMMGREDDIVEGSKIPSPIGGGGTHH